MNKLFVTILFFFNLLFIKSQDFTTYSLRLYSGGLSIEQDQKLSLASWSIDNGNEDKEERIKTEREIKLYQSQNTGNSKLNKLENKYNKLLHSEINSFDNAYNLYHEVYIDIIKNLKKKIKNKDDVYKMVENKESSGNQQFKKANELIKANNNQTQEQEIENKQNAIAQKKESLEVLLLAMEGYYNILQDKSKAEIESKLNGDKNDRSNQTGENEIIVISKDALMHYSDRPDVHSMILENYNVDTIEFPIYISLNELRAKKEKQDSDIVETTDINNTQTEIENIISDNSVSENSLNNDHSFQKTVQIPAPIQTNTDKPVLIKTNPVEIKANKSEFSENEYYTIQFLARRTPLSKEQLKQYYPKLADVEIKFEDNWYKYQYGKYSSNKEAITNCNKLNLKNSFVAKYNNETRISIVYFLSTKTENL